MAHYESGLYDCIISSQGFDESKEKRTPCFWLRFLPKKRNGEEIDGEYEREVKLWLTDKTIERVVDLLRALGWDGTSFKDLEPGGHIFKGLNIQLNCRHEQDGDKVYESWDFPFEGASQSESKDGMGKKVDALFGKALKRKARTSKPAKAEPVAAVADDEDDVPF